MLLKKQTTNTQRLAHFPYANSPAKMLPMKAKPNAQPNQSLIDGMSIVHALATAAGPVGGRELSRQLDFEPTRVNRLLKTLAYIGVARQTKDRKYTAGPAMHVLASHGLFASGFLREALPRLEELRAYDLTVALGVLWRFNVSYLYHALPGMPSAEAIGRLALLPATQVGTGLILLAQEDEDVIRAHYGDAPIPGFASIDALIERLRQARKEGFVRLLVKPELDQHTIAVPVGEGAHCAIAFSGQIAEADTAKLVAVLQQTAQAIGGD